LAPKTRFFEIGWKKRFTPAEVGSELIDQETRTWNETAVRECCLPHDAAVILTIKLPQRATEEFVAWSGVNNGPFSVRSAYRIGLQMKNQGSNTGQSSSEATGDRKIWDVIWKANVPPKLRVFAWRVASDSLGTRLNLSRRIDTVSPTCAICGCKAEDAHHALVDCTLPRALREELREHWTLPTELSFRENNKDWIFTLLINAPKDQRPKIIFLLWRSWHHRNNIVHGDGKASVSASVSYLVNYHSSTVKAGDDIGSGTSSWILPAAGAVKANVDAGWDSASKMAGIGIIVRNHRGSPLVAEWKPIPDCGSAEEAEVIACLHGLRQLVELQCWPATIETDCLRAVQAISSDQEERSACWTSILEIRELLKIFQDISIVKIDRVCNGVAHVLAQLGRSGLSDCLRDSAPDCVQDLITLDCMNTV
jgi:ribonuclease HI